MKRYTFFAFLVFFAVVGVFAQEIGRVEVGRNTFVVHAPNGSRISSTNIGNGSHTLVGWGRDFFAVQNGNFIYTHDVRGRQIASWSHGTTNIRAIVYNDRVIVFHREGDSRIADLNRELR